MFALLVAHQPGVVVLAGELERSARMVERLVEVVPPQLDVGEVDEREAFRDFECDLRAIASASCIAASSRAGSREELHRGGLGHPRLRHRVAPLPPPRRKRTIAGSLERSLRLLHRRYSWEIW